MKRVLSLHTLLRALGLLTVVLVLVAAYTPLPNIFARSLAVPSQVRSADAIVVLGAGVHRDGTLSEPSLRRAVQGMVLYQRGLAPLILFSGPSYEGSPVESEVRAVLARQLCIPEHAILLETRAQTTAEEAQSIAAQLRQHHVRSILLVTNSLHLARAVPRFAGLGLKVFPVATDDIPLDTDSPDKRLALMLHALREAAAMRLYQAGE